MSVKPKALSPSPGEPARPRERELFFWRNGEMRKQPGLREMPWDTAMRSLIASRRGVEPKLTPNQIALRICADGYLREMFRESTLEKWQACEEWRAWELFEPIAFNKTAEIMTVRCGYPSDGGWWGGRYYPLKWISDWITRGYRRPMSAWENDAWVERYCEPVHPDLEQFTKSLISGRKSEAKGQIGSWYEREDA